MVTTNIAPDKKVVKMAEQSSGAVVPQRTLLEEVNVYITCPLCRGYYIDATTIVECLHSFCRSCIIKHLLVKSYCPECEMMINSAKPNIKLDKALQDIVYKLVPGLFQKEMERRQLFYASRPGQAASTTPEQRGEDTERIIFSPEDVISFSLEYADATDTDSISSKSSDSNEPQTGSTVARRYLQCPAVVNISHLKKFLSMKFDIDCTQFSIYILYKRVPLPDYYTLMDIAYIYNWKRNEPMRFFYQIIDYSVAIRKRFDISRKSSNIGDRKSSPTPNEETNVCSPAPTLNDLCSEVSSGTDSPVLDNNSVNKTDDALKIKDKNSLVSKDNIVTGKNNNSALCRKNDEDVEKSQFLNKFELTAKNMMPPKSSSTKPHNDDSNISKCNLLPKTPSNCSKTDTETLKRKQQSQPNTPEFKKLKIELEKTKLPQSLHNSGSLIQSSKVHNETTLDAHCKIPSKLNDEVSIKQNPQISLHKNNTPSIDSQTLPTPEKQEVMPSQPTKTTTDNNGTKVQQTENSGIKRPSVQQNLSPKRKATHDVSPPTQSTSSLSQKTISPLKLHVPKLESLPSVSKIVDLPKPKKLPDLKPSVLSSQMTQSKPVNKVRMDFLANNSDPTIDRSKILSQVKTTLPVSNAVSPSGDPLKSLFNSCNINIPSSLSITLTEQSRNLVEQVGIEQNKILVNKNLSGATSGVHKLPSPPVHNSIQILKLPDIDPKKQPTKSEDNGDSTAKPPPKSSESSAKGPIPNLKPISDTKLAKQSGNFQSSPITFQQTFEQQLQSLQSDKKSKIPKNKSQVPKLMPATPKTFSALNNANNKPTTSTTPLLENKSSSALDLSTPHNVQSQLGPEQTKAFETMQSIANLAKKQSLPSKGLPSTMSQGSFYSANRTLTSPMRVPTTNIHQIKLDKINTSGSQTTSITPKSNQTKQLSALHTSAAPPQTYQSSSNPNNTKQSSPKALTRSPSSSPKLVIAEEKQNNSSEQNINQSNQISSTQIPNINTSKTETPKSTPGPSKINHKLIKPGSAGKITSMQQPIIPNVQPNSIMSSSSDYLSQPQMQTFIRQSLEMQQIHNAWLKATQMNLLKNKNMSKMPQSQSDFNNKEKH